jgi:hypothetical protein
MRSTSLLSLAAGLLAVTAALVTALPAGARTAGTPTYTLSTATAEIHSGHLNQGHWTQASGHDQTNSNYIVGQNETGNRYHDFFTFALSGTQSPCEPTSAVLHVPAAGGGNQALFATGPASLTYDLFDVTTDPVTLNTTGAANASIYSDLNSGSLYGSYSLSTSVTNTTFNLALNGNALADIAAAKQSGSPYFSIGGAIVPEPSTNYNFLYGFSSAAITLTLTYPRLCKVYP